MNRLTPYILALLSLALLSGCGSSGSVTNTAEEAPDWMAQVPDEDQYVLGSGTGQASSYGVALEKAEIRARQDIGEGLETQMRSMTEDFRETVSGEDLRQFTQTTRTVVNQTLIGTSTRDVKVVESGGRFRAYVLMEMPVGEMAKEFMSMVAGNDQEMYTRFRKSEAFDRMQEAIENYEQNQKQ